MSDVRAPLHVRTIRVEATEDGGDALLLTGTLVDERPRGGDSWFGVEGPRVIHRMELALHVRHRDLVITEVRGGMEAHPYRICPDAVPPLQRLVGVSVAQGFTRIVNERLGRQRGCAHLTALIHAMAPVVKQAAGVAFGASDTGDKDPDDPWVIDTCQAWRENGPLHRLVRAGDRAGLQEISAYRPAGGEAIRDVPVAPGDGAADGAVERTPVPETPADPATGDDRASPDRSAPRS